MEARTPLICSSVFPDKAPSYKFLDYKTMLKHFLYPTTLLSHSLSDRKLPLRIVENARSKRLTLTIEPGGKGLRISIPPETEYHEIQHFISRYHGWIETRLAGFPVPAQGTIVGNGTKIPLFWTLHRIIHSAGRGVTRLDKQNNEPQIIVYGEKRYLARRVRDYLKKQAEKTIAPLVTKHSHTIGHKPKSIHYKDMTSRWGSCSSAGRLSFSWRIVMAPCGIIDYLVAHEVAHLVEMNHSLQFWALCRKLCPDTDQHRIWLKRNGQILHAVDFNQESTDILP